MTAIFSCIISSYSAYGRQESPFVIGSVARAYAGATLLTTKGSAAAFYNPAAIGHDAVDTLDYDLSALSLTYTYEYPGFEATSVHRNAVIPYIGASKHLNNKNFFALALLPFPGRSELSHFRKLPTREAGETPILVNIKQQGPKLGWRGAIGFGRQENHWFSYGASLIFHRDGIEREVHDVETGLHLRDESKLQDLYEVLLATKIALPKIKSNLAFRIIPWGYEKKTHSQNTLSINGFESSHDVLNEKRPLQFALAFEKQWEIGNHLLGTIYESGYAFWKELSDTSKTQYDFHNNMSQIATLYYDYEAKLRFNLSLGYYTTHLGDGLMNIRNSEDIEIIGMKTGQFSGFNRRIFSVGVERKLQSWSMIGYFNWQTGKREIFEDARDYGTHTLTLVFLGLGGQWQL